MINDAACIILRSWPLSLMLPSHKIFQLFLLGRNEYVLHVRMRMNQVFGSRRADDGSHQCCYQFLLVCFLDMVGLYFFAPFVQRHVNRNYFWLKV